MEITTEAGLDDTARRFVITNTAQRFSFEACFISGWRKPVTEVKGAGIAFSL